GRVQSFEALYNYTALRDNELSFEEGDMLFVLDQSDDNWWLAMVDNQKGLIPSNYVSVDNIRVPLIDAARRGNLGMVEECLRVGVSVNCLDKAGNAALHVASQAGHLNVISRLLKETRLELDLQNKLGDTPLHCASYRGHSEIVKLLLNQGARTDIVNRDKHTPRQLARRGTVIGILEQETLKGVRLSSGLDDHEYAPDEAEDSD
ncbi:unnamed protein product, partial [Meganyctiphanes norvegica]